MILGTHHSETTRLKLRESQVGKRRGFKRDLTNKTFGRLTVVRLSNSYKKETLWDCICKCSKNIEVSTRNLNSGNTRSCGCLQSDAAIAKNTTHGLSKSVSFSLYHSAKQRSKRLGIPFDIILSDIQVPEMCPVLGLRLKQGVKNPTDSSPTLDRIIPKKGYIAGNVKVICDLANRIKQNATAEQIRKVAEYVEREVA